MQCQFSAGSFLHWPHSCCFDVNGVWCWGGYSINRGATPQSRDLTFFFLSQQYRAVVRELYSLDSWVRKDLAGTKLKWKSSAGPWLDTKRVGERVGWGCTCDMKERPTDWAAGLSRTPERTRRKTLMSDLLFTVFVSMATPGLRTQDLTIRFCCIHPELLFMRVTLFFFCGRFMESA